MTPREYYANADVQKRILEFLGGDGIEDASCRCLACGA